MATQAAPRSFTRMQDGQPEQWMVIAKEHQAHYKTSAPMRIMEHLRDLGELTLGFACDQLHHSLMTATLARRDDASDEEVVAALCHDIGKTMSVPNHGAIAAELLKPYVSDDLFHVIKYHQDFQGAYYYNYLGRSTTMREDHKDKSWYGLACKLVDEWDAPAFDPDFQVDSLESFEPEVVRVFTEPKMM
ncbi:HD domain-containing protein [Parasphingopyxis marina]|uniref:HD domain-containing protein n=1 Tax=Parasphingopyxis marina TaxID=2761622 RepID=A0A842HWA8_9SPHN|nr:HD domain-containing protein [Parasphingopyxis marina]MBC2776707.1 HD domain-containing protein [Parasphingopyxis marina]